MTTHMIIARNNEITRNMEDVTVSTVQIGASLFETMVFWNDLEIYSTQTATIEAATKRHKGACLLARNNYVEAGKLIRR